MSELTPEEIGELRADPHPPSDDVRAACDMALRTHKAEEALRCILNTPPDYRPAHQGHNERKAWAIIDEMKSQAHTALRSHPPAQEDT